MISRELRLVITFSSTTDALTMEQSCKENQIPGRLIPVPRIISASCGLAWSTDVTEEKVIQDLLTHIQVKPEGIYQCMI
nr:DUF3343 domain-containing protein [uncultured Blautia sp.]